jgi:hypothetical protein
MCPLTLRDESVSDPLSNSSSRGRVGPASQDGVASVALVHEVVDTPDASQSEVPPPRKVQTRYGWVCPVDADVGRGEAEYRSKEQRMLRGVRIPGRLSNEGSVGNDWARSEASLPESIG